jgi:amidase
MLQKDAEPLNTYDYWRLSHSRQLYVQEQLGAWEATAQFTGTGRPIDAILAPPSSCLPPAHGTPQYIYYTSFASLCDYTASVLPTGTFDASLDVQAPAHDFRCEADRFVYENCALSLTCSLEQRLTLF